jgi:outer membrane protein OmpA-like peptidoglycan-associated protein
MKKSTLITTLVLSMTLTTANVNAKGKTEENVGFFSGAIAGAAVGGPIGFIFGGAIGAFTGNQVSKANQLDQATAELSSEKRLVSEMQEQIERLNSTVETLPSNESSQSSNDVEWITEGLTLNLMFTTNSSKLSANDENMIKRLSSVLNEYPGLNIKLDGYADPRGNEETNMKLSAQRIESVESAFEKYGISANRLNIKAHGESKADQQIIDLDAYAMERRVSIHFYNAEESTVAQN